MYEQQTKSKVVNSGLLVSLSHPYLAASPDGLVHDDIVVEIKCPYKVRDMQITPTTVPFLNETGLKKSCIFLPRAGADVLFRS